MHFTHVRGYIWVFYDRIKFSELPFANPLAASTTVQAKFTLSSRVYWVQPPPVTRSPLQNRQSCGAWCGQTKSDESVPLFKILWAPPPHATSSGWQSVIAHSPESDPSESLRKSWNCKSSNIFARKEFAVWPLAIEGLLIKLSRGLKHFVLSGYNSALNAAVSATFYIFPQKVRGNTAVPPKKMGTTT